MTELASKYPKWTLTIKRTEGPFIAGTCGCGWESGNFVRTVTLAEAWDTHMLRSKLEDHRE